jgi:hypothetical protein
VCLLAASNVLETAASPAVSSSQKQSISGAQELEGLTVARRGVVDGLQDAQELVNVRLQFRCNFGAISVQFWCILRYVVRSIMETHWAHSLGLGNKTRGPIQKPIRQSTRCWAAGVWATWCACGGGGAARGRDAMTSRAIVTPQGRGYMRQKRILRQDSNCIARALTSKVVMGLPQVSKSPPCTCRSGGLTLYVSSPSCIHTRGIHTRCTYTVSVTTTTCRKMVY